MVKRIALKTIFALSFAVLLTISAFASGLEAQIAVEDTLSTDLNFRGQGRAGLCYAFAEEQLLKDLTCTENCQSNASQWKFSIFDIARAHQAEWARKLGKSSIKSDLSRDLFANGSSFVFPYNNVGIKSTRAGECTLESDVFFLNRSKTTNPDRLILADFLIALFFKFKSGTAPALKVNAPTLIETWNILRNLAQTSSSEFDFLAKVIGHTKCTTRVPLPVFTIQSKDLSESQEISELITGLLNNGRSLYVGVCAEVLESEKFDSNPCGRHAVVLKRLRRSQCSSSECNNEILVVDSAFFSKRPRNKDGATWIPASVVIQAIAKSGENAKQIREKVNQSQGQLNFKNQAAQVAISTTNSIRQAVISSGSTKIKETALAVLASSFENYPPESTEVKMYHQIVREVQALNISSIEDLPRLKVLLERNFLPAIEEALGSSNGLSFNGIVWLE